ncbi:MAG TPA: transposase [Ktedonobacterales bacterium]|jgi:transposase/heme-degrading monooxygenase HmoA
MIIRVFAARLKPGMRHEYDRLCRDVAIPLMRGQPGFLDARIVRVREDRPNEFALVSLWRDIESIRGFVGDQWQQAVILPGEADLLEEVSVQHFDESYQSLVALWRAMASVVKRRELTAAGTPLTDTQWTRIQPLLPPRRREGRPRADDRRTLDGILYVLRAGCRWHDLPATYGSHITCWRRFTHWEADGTWSKVWRALLDTLDNQGKQAWALAFLDGPGVPGGRQIPSAPTKRRR